MPLRHDFAIGGAIFLDRKSSMATPDGNSNPLTFRFAALPIFEMLLHRQSSLEYT